MSQLQQTARLYWIDAEIRADRYPNATKVAANFEVTPRTAFADFRHLRDDLKAPVRTRRAQGWYYTDPTYMLPFLALSEPEAQSLRRSLRVAEEYLSQAEAYVVGLLLERLAPQLRRDWSNPISFSSLHPRCGSDGLRKITLGEVVARLFAVAKRMDVGPSRRRR